MQFGARCSMRRLAMAEWKFAFTDVEVFAALVAHIERERGIKLPITEDGLLHLVTHRKIGGGFTMELFSETRAPPPAPRPVVKFRWPWEPRLDSQPPRQRADRTREGKNGP